MRFWYEQIDFRYWPLWMKALAVIGVVVMVFGCCVADINF